MNVKFSKTLKTLFGSPSNWDWASLISIAMLIMFAIYWLNYGLT